MLKVTVPKGKNTTRRHYWLITLKKLEVHLHVYWNRRLKDENTKIVNPLYAPRKLGHKIFCRFKDTFKLNIIV